MHPQQALDREVLRSKTTWSYSSRPPDPMLVGDAWVNMWTKRLKAEPFLPIKWLEHQTRDNYWKHGSVCENYDGIQSAVLAIGGWGDAYKNAVSHLVSNIKSPVKGLVGPWVHKYPHFAVPELRNCEMRILMNPWSN